ncbi:hypothetical protein [Cesiribacter sp. SM1]|uniref:hypothetical protein n=1 Tax=Cesiribacter sp. SM1 TaxID=2861196 RepID=UPI001CD3886E|nr:hypothetical protein [Cesiribacter sp. SM1]
MKLIIKTAQLCYLSADLKTKANLNMAEYLRKRFPLEFASTDVNNIIQLISKQRKAANSYGVEKENDIATFLDFSVMYGEGFHLDEWAQDVLQCIKLYGPDKMALLRHYVRRTGIEL